MVSPNPTKLTISINPKTGMKPIAGKPNKGANSGVEISISDLNNKSESVSLDMAEIEKNKEISLDLGSDNKKKELSVSLGPNGQNSGISVSMSPGKKNNNVSVKLRSGGKEKDITKLIETNSVKTGGISNDKIGDQQLCDIINLLESTEDKKEYKVKSYKISKACPNILSILANQLRVTVSQRKAILPILEERLDKKVNIRDNNEFYLSFLNVIEADLGVVAIFLSAIIPNQQTKAISAENYLSKAADDFPPVKLAIKTYLRRGRILSSIKNSGLNEISELDRLGIIFYYGFHFGLNEYILGKFEAKDEKETVTKEIESSKVVETRKEVPVEPPNLVNLEDFVNALDVTDKDDSDYSKVRFKLAKALFDTATCLLFSDNPVIVEKLQLIAKRFQDRHKDYQLELREKEVARRIEETFGHKVKFKLKETEILEEIEGIVSESEELVAQFHFDTFQIKRKEKIQTKISPNVEEEYATKIQSEISNLKDQLTDTETKVQSNWELVYSIIESIKAKVEIANEKSVETIVEKVKGQEVEKLEGKKDEQELKLEQVEVAKEPKEVQQDLDLKQVRSQPVQKYINIGQVKDEKGKSKPVTEERIEPKISKEQLEFDNSNQKILAELIKEDFLAIAKQFAFALRRSGNNCEIPHEVLDFAAGCRISFENYDASANIFQNRLEDACASAKANTNANLILFGSLLRPAILQPSTMVRERIGQLSLGQFSNCVSDLAIYLSNLDFSFSPTLDELAAIAGRTADSRQSQIEKELSEWVDNTLKRNGPCQPSTMVVHRLVRAGGDFGKVIEHIKNGKVQRATESATLLIEEYRTNENIYSRLKERNQISDSKAREFPTLTLQYIYRRIEEGRDLLEKWLHVIGIDDKKEISHSGDLKKISVRLEKLALESITKLDEIVNYKDPLTSALGFWIRYQIEDVCELLKGRITPTWGDFDTARNEELDLLPIMTALEDNQDEIEAEDKAIIKFLRSESIPTVNDAIQAHIANGAFRKAARLVHWLDSGKSKDELLIKIIDTRQKQIENSFDQIQQKMKLLREIDTIELLPTEYIKQNLIELEEIYENLKIERDLELDSIASSTVADIPSDLDEISRYLKRLDYKINSTREELISTHQCRLKKFSQIYAKQTGKFANLFEKVELFGLPNLEDQVARIRDCRAIEFEKRNFKSSLDEYLQDFASNSGKNGWPSNYREYDIAFRNNPLFTATKERRDEAREIMQTWFDIELALMKDESAEFKLKEFLQYFGFNDVVLRKGSKNSDLKLWLYTGFLRITMNSKVFVPPLFGTESNNFYNVVVLHNSVLIEDAVSIIEPSAPTIVFVMGHLVESVRKDLTLKLRQNRVNALVIDETLASYLAIRAEKKFESLLDCGFSIGSINPYEITSKEEIPPELFFGREFEINKVMSQSNEGVFIYGGRNSGKSAILNQISYRFHNPDKNCFVLRINLDSIKLNSKTSEKFFQHFAEMIPSEIIKKSAVDLTKPDKFIDNLNAWIKTDKSHRLVCLFDNCDDFIVSEAQNNFENLMLLQQLMVDTKYAVKLVFSGSLNLQRLFNILNSTLNQFGSAICVGPLNRTKEDLEEAYQMIVEPMQLAGFRFAEKEIPENLLTQLSFFPSLMQLFGVELINHLNTKKVDTKNGPPWYLSHETLLIGKELLVEKQQIRQKFREMLDADPRYKLVAYAMGYIKWQDGNDKVVFEGLSADEILNVLDEYWPKQLEKLVATELEIILNELFEIGVLGKFETEEDGILYCFRTSQLTKLVGSENRMIEELLSMEEIEPNQSYDPLVYRPLLAEKGDKDTKNETQIFSPLTIYQLQKLVDCTSASSIRLVVGTEALGIDQVCDSISEYAENIEGIGDNNVSVEIAPNIKKYLEIVKSTPNLKTKSTLVCFAPKDKIPEDLLVKLQSMNSLKSGKIKTVLVLNAAIPSHRKLVRDQWVMYLRPWGGEMVKGYLKKLDIPSDISVLNSILAKTGGISTEVMKIVSQINPKDNATTSAEKIDNKGKPVQYPLDKKYNEAIAILANVSGIAKDSSESKSEIYKLANDEVSKIIGNSLDEIGDDLMSFGILELFDSKKKFYRVSKLGRFVARQVE